MAASAAAEPASGVGLGELQGAGLSPKLRVRSYRGAESRGRLFSGRVIPHGFRLRRSSRATSSSSSCAWLSAAAAAAGGSHRRVACRVRSAVRLGGGWGGGAGRQASRAHPGEWHRLYMGGGAPLGRAPLARSGCRSSSCPA
eukprot:scaffold8139_cov363-Prasinococcus_capsulatus_cf.AAC.1